MLLAAAIVLIKPGVYTDLTGLLLVGGALASQRLVARAATVPVPAVAGQGDG